ncbi:MAG: COX15/CtaA family protein, partial [Pyrinomonadaceae bacterium]
TVTKLDRFAKYAWFVVAFNIVVILWGVFLRASKSGDGCGQHWVTCNGEVLPSAPQLKTIIEFSHRVTSSLAGLLIVALLIWAFRRWYTQKTVQERLALITVAGSFVFVVIEGLIGRGLVLTGNTAENLTPERPFWMAGHLINTLILLTFLTLTARYAGGGRRMNFRVERKYIVALAAGTIAIFVVGISGSIAALSSMLFPSMTLTEAIAKDFSPTSHILLRLRLLHPITAILTSVFLIFLTGWLAKERAGDPKIARWSNILSVLVLLQIGFGSLTLLMLAPIVMQLGHLLFADAIWISYVLFAAAFLSSEGATAEASA